MSTLKVFEGKEKEKEIFLKLVDAGSHISLLAVDEHGNRLPAGHILKISKSEGTLTLSSGVSKELGLKLSANRRIEIE